MFLENSRDKAFIPAIFLKNFTPSLSPIPHKFYAPLKNHLFSRETFYSPTQHLFWQPSKNFIRKCGMKKKKGGGAYPETSSWIIRYTLFFIFIFSSIFSRPPDGSDCKFYQISFWYSRGRFFELFKKRGGGVIDVHTCWRVWFLKRDALFKNFWFVFFIVLLCCFNVCLMLQ